MAVLMAGRLTAEDLARWRLSDVKRTVAQRAPEVYSVNEHEALEMTYLRLLGEFVETYQIDDSRDWHISQYTGLIYYGTVAD